MLRVILFHFVLVGITQALDSNPCGGKKAPTLKDAAAVIVGSFPSKFQVWESNADGFAESVVIGTADGIDQYVFCL